MSKQARRVVRNGEETIKLVIREVCKYKQVKGQWLCCFGKLKSSLSEPRRIAEVMLSVGFMYFLVYLLFYCCFYLWLIFVFRNYIPFTLYFTFNFLCSFLIYFCFIHSNNLNCIFSCLLGSCTSFEKK